jgi:hypothetical protein
MHGHIDMQAKGEFEVKRTPQGQLDAGGGLEIGHMRFDKHFHGPLEARSVVQMLALMSAVPGSGAYVAIERIEGVLDGRSGSFCMQHNGVMDRGQPSLSLSVIPDTGAGELVGLRGKMAIDIVDGQHFYTFDYDIRED